MAESVSAHAENAFPVRPTQPNDQGHSEEQQSDTANAERLAVAMPRKVTVYPGLLRWEKHSVARERDARWTTLNCGANGRYWVSGPTGQPLVLVGGGYAEERGYSEPIMNNLYFEAEGDRLHLTIDGGRVRSICATPETVRALGGHERTALIWMSAWASANGRSLLPPAFASRDRLVGILVSGVSHPMTFARPLVGAALPNYEELS
jgi:hypothetical protein